MKDDMYTYHYFKKRSIICTDKTSDYLMQTVVLGGVAYAAVTLLVMFNLWG